MIAHSRSDRGPGDLQVRHRAPGDVAALLRSARGDRVTRDEVSRADQPQDLGRAFTAFGVRRVIVQLEKAALRATPAVRAQEGAPARITLADRTTRAGCNRCVLRRGFFCFFTALICAACCCRSVSSTSNIRRCFVTSSRARSGCRRTAAHLESGSRGQADEGACDVRACSDVTGAG
jgi:hypothetical protein